MDNKIFTNITQKIASSKKYKSIYPGTIGRIVKDCYEKYGEKHAEEKARNLLHQIWGAYYPTRPNFRRLLEKLHSEQITKEKLKQLLTLHASTKERIPILDIFYKKIFSITGMPDSIIDHACGLHPLTLPWMHLPETTRYTAYDIDSEEIIFLQEVIKQLDIRHKIILQAGDIFIGTPIYADVIFMLKFLPNLEQQVKNSSLEIMKKQLCKFLVVSFPLKSLGGKEKGMTDFYTRKFLKDIQQENWKYQKLVFETELVFVVRKNE